MRITRLRPALWLLFAGMLVLVSRGLAQDKSPAPPAEQPAVAKAPTPEPAEAPKARPERARKPGDVQKVFEVHHASPVELARLLDVFPATIRYSSGRTRAIAVSAAPAVMAAVEETVKRLDVPESSDRARPSPNVELTGYVVEALAKPLEGARVPAELEGVVAQLKRTFNYAAYRLVDTLIARAREGSSLDAKALADTPQGGGSDARSYSLRVRRVGVSTGSAGPVIRLDHLAFGSEVPVPVAFAQGGPGQPSRPTSYQYRSVGVDADLDIREGQHVVVGKSGAGEAGNALILVLTAKVVD
jgi:hypothetical protein